MTKTKLTTLAIAIAIAASLSPVKSFADTDNVSTFEAIEVVGTRPDYKTESVSTATKMDIAPLETPRSVNSIDRKLLDDLQATSLDKALKNDASTVSTYESDGHENFYIRGFQLTTNDGYLRNGEQKYSLIQEPVEMYERIEVLKGPSGLLYGKGSPAGLVNMVTKEPEYQRRTMISQDVGSNNFSRSVVDTTGSATDDLRYRVIASKQSKDNFRHYVNGVHPTTRRDLLAIMLDYDLTDDTMLSLSYDYKTQKGHQDSGAYFDEDGNIIGDRDLILNTPWSTNEKEEESIGVKLTHHFDNDWKLTASYHKLNMANTAKTSSIRPMKDSAQTGKYEFNTGKRDNSYDVHTGTMDLTGDFNTGSIEHKLLVGTNFVDHEYSRNSLYGGVKQAASTNPAAPIYGFDPSKSGKPSSNVYSNFQTGLYIQDLITFNDYWQVLVGARADYYIKYRSKNDKRDGKGKDTEYFNVLPSAAVMFHPSADSTIYASYSQSFVPQTPISSSSDANDGMEREPELGHLYEIGYKQEFMDNRAIFETSLFQIVKENISVTDRKYRDPSNPAITKKTEQGGKQINTGIDTTITGRVTELLTVKAGAQYLIAEYEGQPKYDGKKIADVPQWTANAWANYELTDHIDLNAGVYYIGSRYGNSANDEPKKSAYTLADVGAIYRMPMDSGDELSFRAKINNVFDKEYETSGDYSGMSIGEGRNYMLSAQYEF
ncbi:TonB-dependent siderophore receptor [Aliivibrio fischeri]|uniref:TonB-dependent siderophore receptor n=1 Tax=Aliivibrio fischeri TaxID=668 RepID=UPI0007C4CC50|nr:TonB-dependent receptor [Aliivibrio fischeri]